MTLATSLMALARQQAERLLDAARLEADALRRDAAAAGRREGLMEARQAVLSQHLAWSERVRRELEAEVERRLAAWADEVEAPLVELALDVARLVVGEAVDGRTVPLAVERIRAALHSMGAATHARVYSCVDDRTAVEAALRDGGLDVTVVGDASVEPGFCRVESPHGTTDARLEVQMRRIREEIAEA